MDLLESLYMTDVLHTLSDGLLIPTVIILVVLVLFSLWCIGSILTEWVFERKRYRAYLPALVADISRASYESLPEVVEGSEILRSQKDDLLELRVYLGLPKDARTGVARRLLANEDASYDKVLTRTEVAAKVAPMLGLMGTLIPLGPGVVALGTGDVETLSTSLLVAFDTTVAGLAAAVVCYMVTRVRRRWYSDYLVSMEAAFDAMLELAESLHAEGFSFPEAEISYDARGKRAAVRSTRLGTEGGRDGN